ncbi:MAG: hypothetical protein M0D57_09095 [Sphingobacteriales bacterium JAD_PAG50586_3]|nr:MAG: hypothetical protein M0D57_09095 [Sphingobacteriales bacterium JAD_PAG50586_3]
MKTIRNISFAAITTALLLSSCSVEKRRYRPGYNVDAGKKTPKTEAAKTPNQADTGDKTVIIIPEYAIPPASKENVAVDYTNEYSIYLVVGPRPDKKGKKNTP